MTLKIKIVHFCTVKKINYGIYISTSAPHIQIGSRFNFLTKITMLNILHFLIKIITQIYFVRPGDVDVSA